MSVEIRLAQPCPHQIVEEPVTLGADRRSMVTRSPIASTNSVRVLANDEVFIPPAGLYSQALLVGDAQEPFYISDCDRTLTISASTCTTTVRLRPGSGGAVFAADVARDLSTGLPDVSVRVVDGHLVLEDYGLLGPSSRLMVRGPAASHLGFGVQRGASGTQVYPGWRLVGAASSRYPVFWEPLRSSPALKVSYVAVGALCQRCGGTYVENDWQYSLQGDVLMIANEDVLVQAALKILLTRLRSNPYHPTYGTTIMNRVGSKAVGPVAAQIAQEVRSALATLAATQGQQSKYQAVTASERLYAVKSVNVTQDSFDPTRFNIDVVVSNAASAPVSVSIVYTAPGAVALQGSNGLSLG